MDEITRSIAKNIQNGQYYKDAREWYSFRYLAPVTERSLLFVITLVAILSGIIAVVTSKSMFPTMTEVPVVVKVDDAIDHYTAIHRLSDRDATGVIPYNAVAQYLVEHYVRIRESYDYTQFEPQYLRMRGASSKKVFREFQQEMSLENPNSRTVRLGRHSTRTVLVTKFQFAEDNDLMHKAWVTFETETMGGGQDAIKEMWAAEISFTMTDVDTARDTKKMEFRVTNYKVKKLS